MKIISIINQKGGVAKTTSAITIAVGLAKENKKVLLVDFDPQANATTGLGIDKLDLKYTVYDLLKADIFSAQYSNLKLSDVMISKFGVDILPTNIKMSRIESELGGFPGKENYLKDLLKTIKGYDYTIIDCPPTLSMLTHNALTAATDVYIPVKADYYSLEGIGDLLEEIHLIKKKINDKLNISGVFITMANTRTSLYKETRERLQKYFKDELFDTAIRTNEDINKAVGEGKTILYYKSSSNGAEDYKKLIKEIIKREKK